MVPIEKMTAKERPSQYKRALLDVNNDLFICLHIQVRSEQCFVTSQLPPLIPLWSICRRGHSAYVALAGNWQEPIQISLSQEDTTMEMNKRAQIALAVYFMNKRCQAITVASGLFLGFRPTRDDFRMGR